MKGIDEEYEGQRDRWDMVHKIAVRIELFGYAYLVMLLLILWRVW